MREYLKDNDLRHKYHIVQNFSYDRGMVKPSFSYPGYIFFYNNRVPSGPTTSEMYLIKAECHARNGQIPEAMTALNQLRNKRMKTGTPEIVASSKEEAVKKVLDERRREMPFSMRWYDLRRLNNNEDPTDDVNLSRQFYPYTSANAQTTQSTIEYKLGKNSSRYAAPSLKLIYLVARELLSKIRID